MARTGWAVVVFAGLVVSYMACQNTWKGLRRDTEENTEIAKRKAKEAHLDEKARAAGQEMKEAAHDAGQEIKHLAGRLRGHEDTAAPAPNQKPTTTGHGNTSREVNEATGKVTAAAREAGHEVAEAARESVVHVDIWQSLEREHGLDASHIDIDVQDESHTVVIRGSVPDHAQKTTAERLAREHAHGYTVRDELAVAAAPAR
jgi:osmotically-inducible protein OsmY